MAGNITIRLEQAFEGFEGDFKSLYSKDSLKRILNEMSQVAESRRRGYLDMLRKSLTDLGISYDGNKVDYQYYENLIENSDLPSEREMLPKVLCALYDIYETYPTPDEYMKRIVGRLRNADDRWENDSLRLQILKQFIKYGNYLTKAGYSDKAKIEKYVKEKNNLTATPSVDDVCRLLDDEIFNQSDLAIVKTSDDLATGCFRTGGGTKKALYLFAMVYDMTFYYGAEGQIPLPESDIMINLFQDYYTNNLIRFLTTPYMANPTAYELDPSGQGINYKNFAEAVYLYYIGRRGMSATEKIEKSSKMIEALKKSAIEKSNGRNHIPTSEQTVNIKQKYLNAFELDEEGFKAYIEKEYDCNTRLDKSYLGPLTLETEQNTAFKIYEGIQKAIMEKYGPSWERECRGLWFLDENDPKELMRAMMLSYSSNLETTKLDRFLDLVLAFDSVLRGNSGIISSNSKNRALTVTDPKNMTRTVMIIAFYYFYIIEHEEDPKFSFEQEFIRFKNEADEKLENAFYPLISTKSIFDLMIAFSAYAYLNNAEL